MFKWELTCMMFWVLMTEMYEGDSVEDAWYFFTKRDKKSEKASRPSRIITGNNGYWKATGSEVAVKDGDGKLVGGKRALVYYGGGKGKAAKKTDWLMKEYTFDNLVNASRGETKVYKSPPYNAFQFLLHILTPERV